MTVNAANDRIIDKSIPHISFILFINTPPKICLFINLYFVVRRYITIATKLLEHIFVLDNKGAIVIKYKYDVWGKCLIDASTTNIELANLNPFRYRSYYFDTETGFYFLKTRYYDPEIGRFMTIDDISYLDPESINGLNLYAYCGNDPVDKFDPSGYSFVSVLIGLGIAALIGAAIGAGSYAVGQGIDYAITGNFEWSWGGFFGSTIGGAIGGMIAYALPWIGVGSVAVGAFFSGATTTAGTMIGQNITDNTSYSSIDILLSAVIAGMFSALSVGVMSKIRIPGLNAGRGSYSAVSSQVYTKFRNQTISTITMKTFGKMLAVEAYSGIAGFVFDDVYDFLGIDDLLLSLY